ncbi:MAG TPA: hypothetical protein VL961_06420 [Acidimicrobiales bacterium]|nr:hypothetical protein [Acidimicrobiales bacterium]
MARAVAPHPSLWWAATAALVRLRRDRWWRRRPFLPLPGDSYWKFREVTAFGSGPDAGVEPADVVAYLRWCQRSRPRRG